MPLYGATIDAVHGQRYCYLFMKYISGFYDFYIYTFNFMLYAQVVPWHLVVILISLSCMESLGKFLAVLSIVTEEE